MRTVHSKKAYAFDDTIYNIFVNLGLNACYHLSDEREYELPIVFINDEETFLRKATDVTGKKAKEIAKNLLEIGLTKDSVALTA